MSAPSITLQDYEQAERVIAHEDARAGLIAHSTVTVLVSAVLVVINFTLAAEFPWSVFAVVGMTIGLAAHWWFGYRHLDSEVTDRQHQVEERAAHLH
jgi:carbon starvation protein CstA